MLNLLSLSDQLNHFHETIQQFYQSIDSPSHGTVIMISLAVILMAGFLMTRITKIFKLPNVTGYIFAGIIIGPYVLGLVADNMITSMEFVIDIALAFIAFGVGKYFKFSTLKKTGWRVIIITITEALMAAVIVTLVMLYCFHLPLSFSIMLGAIGSATAPASTIMTIRQYKAKGEFVDALLEVVALDDIVALLAFSVAMVVAKDESGATTFMDAFIPILKNLGAMGLGVLLSFVLKLLISARRSPDNRLIIVIAMILILTGVCTALDVSPLLACMLFGAGYINLTKDKELYHQINNFTPPILTMFFVLSGLRLDISALKTAGIIGIVYFFVRIIGKYLGAWLGAWVTKSSKQIRNYLGLALIPQAGVSIGLAILGQRNLPEELGTLLSTIILSSAILYEMFGPISAKLSLMLSGVISKHADVSPDNNI